MRIGVDLDGVLALPEAAAIAPWNQDKGTNWTMADLTWDGLPGQRKKELLEYLDRAWLLGLVQPHHDEILWPQHSEIWIVTGLNRRCHSAVTAWLDNCNFTYDALMFVPRNFPKRSLPLDALIDDNPQYIQEPGCPLYVVDYPYNRHIPPVGDVVRVECVCEALDYLRE